MTEYEIIGGDGKEYGPYPAEKIRGLLRENRLKPYSKIRPTQGDWTTVEALPEFAQPPVTESAQPPAQPTVATAAPYNPQTHMARVSPVPRPGRQITHWPSRVWSWGFTIVLGCCCGRIPVLGFVATLVSFVTPIAGIICSCIARKQIRESNGTQVGDGMAMTGLICSGVYLLMIAAIILLVVLGIASAAALGGLSGP